MSGSNDDQEVSMTQPEQSNSRFVCDYEGCENGIDTGHALMRVSPKGKGKPFIGMCDEHYVGPIDPVAKVFQDDNHRRGSHS